MNILIPDRWLREHLKTKATQTELKDYLTLCGPSIERVTTVNEEIVYDIEVTTNRPDSMSVLGIAREASTILPRFNIEAELLNDPYKYDTTTFLQNYLKDGSKKLSITTDSSLNPRWTSIVLDTIKVKPSPEWLIQLLELSGIRPINNIVDITNYLMRAFGQPAHAFDYDTIKPKNGVPTMVLRESKKGEKVMTLDGKTHALPGGDIIIEDGSGRLIDLAGIMGALNSSITEKTKTIVLFLQTYNPMAIRKTSMALAHRTEAAQLFEKGIDSELVLPAIMKGVELITELAGGSVASKVYDLYPHPYKPFKTRVSRGKLSAYMGTHLEDAHIVSFLAPLGFSTTLTESEIEITVPSWRSDIEIDVDIIEEIARVYGYHNLPSKLPDTAPPTNSINSALLWEEEIKIRLRDWGYTELYTYSMISESLAQLFSLDTKHMYKIANPLTKDWVYLRPSVIPSVLTTIAANQNNKENLALFELSNIYSYRSGDLPLETPSLVIASTGHVYEKLKGISEALFQLLGIVYPDVRRVENHHWFSKNTAQLGNYGTIGYINQTLLTSIQIKKPVTILELHFSELVKNANLVKNYQPIPKFPPAVEDFTFIVPKEFEAGTFLNAIKDIDSIIYEVALRDTFGTSKTFRVSYLDKQKNLTSEDTLPVREKIIDVARNKFKLTLKT